MDEKDPKDEELNPQGQDDINDADDSFGLPDLEYKPLDEVSEEDTPDEPESVPSEDSEDAGEAQEEEPRVEEDSYDDNSNNSTEDEAEKPELRYQIEESSSNVPKIIGGIFGVLIVAAIIWYVGFYRPKQQKIADDAQAKQELLDKQAAADAAALKKQNDADAAASAEEARLAAEADALAKAGIQILEERTGRYYIVLESFIDGDFARDFGNKIAKEGTPSFLIPPYSKKKMQRVGVGAYETIGEAQAALNNLSSEFGTGKWILKY